MYIHIIKIHMINFCNFRNIYENTTFWSVTKNLDIMPWLSTNHYIEYI